MISHFGVLLLYSEFTPRLVFALTFLFERVRSSYSGFLVFVGSTFPHFFFKKKIFVFFEKIEVEIIMMPIESQKIWVPKNYSTPNGFWCL